MENEALGNDLKNALNDKTDGEDEAHSIEVFIPVLFIFAVIVVVHSQYYGV